MGEVVLELVLNHLLHYLSDDGEDGDRTIVGWSVGWSVLGWSVLV